MKPSSDIERILFSDPIDTNFLAGIVGDLSFMNYGDFDEIYWLNIQGPIYTTYTDNCGTGQIEAMNNVGGDENYHEVIFKQPFTQQELKETLIAAAVDPFGAYYFDGNKNWTVALIIGWWLNSRRRIEYIIERYREELNLPDILDRPLYGPREPIPENYKNWLDFYQNGMKEYLEWYIQKINNEKINLSNLDFDWNQKTDLDNMLKFKKKSR